MLSGGEKGNELWPNFPTEPNSPLQFQGAGTHPWLLERRNAPARIKIRRLAAGDRVQVTPKLSYGTGTRTIRSWWPVSELLWLLLAVLPQLPQVGMEARAAARLPLAKT